MEIVQTKENIDEYEKNIWKNFWKKHNLDGEFKITIYKLVENNQMIGYIRTSYFAGVLHIKEIIIEEKYRGNKRGHQVLEYLDNLAKELKCHKLRLETSSEFMPNAFYLYKKFGYKEETKYINDMFKKDWSVMTKFLKSED